MILLDIHYQYSKVFCSTSVTLCQLSTEQASCPAKLGLRADNKQSDEHSTRESYLITVAMLRFENIVPVVLVSTADFYRRSRLHNQKPFCPS